METSRRELFQLGLAASGLLVLPAYAQVQKESADDFEVLKKTEDARTLDKLIEAGSDRLPDTSNCKEESNSGCMPDYKNNPPSFLYLIDILSSTGSAGSCVLLNDKGYFLTAFHVVAENITKRDHLGKILMFYDPNLGFIGSVTMLSYSERWDLALGKLDCTSCANIEPVRITKANLKDGDLVYGLEYKFPEQSRDGILKKIFSNISLKNRSVEDFMIKSEGLKMYPGALEIKAWDGGITHSIKEIMKLLGFEGKIAHMEAAVVLGEITHGDSGSPIYSWNNDLVGIASMYDFSKLAPFLASVVGSDPKKENISPIVFFPGPDRIREFVKNYIAACCK